MDYGDGGEKYSYFDEELTIDKTYLYRIAARDENGRLLAESYDAEVTTRLPAPKLSAAAASYNSVKLTWSTASAVTGYEIYRCTADSDPVLVRKITKGTTCAYTDGSLLCGAEYTYCIRAYKTVNKVNYFSGESEYTQARPIPSAPAKPAAAPDISAGTIKLTWKAVAGASGYEISRADSADGDYLLIGETGSPKTLTFSDREIYDGNIYFYRVTAYTLSGIDRIYGAASDYVSSSLMIGSPSVRLVSSTYKSAKIGWDKVTGASGYEIWRAEGNGEFVKIATISKGTTVAYNNTKLTTGTIYRYRVLAFTLTKKVRTAESEFSDILEVTPSLSVPATLKVVRSGYAVYRSTTKDGIYYLTGRTRGNDAVTYYDATVDTGVTYYYVVKAAGTYYYRVAAYREISGGTAYSDHVQKSITIK